MLSGFGGRLVSFRGFAVKGLQAVRIVRFKAFFWLPGRIL